MTVSTENQLFWQDILNAMTDGVMIVEKGGKILFVNRAMELLTGFSSEELVGSRCSKLEYDCCLKVPDADESTSCPLFNHGELVDKYCSLKRKDGTLLTVVKNARMIGATGSSLCAVEIQHRVTASDEGDRQVNHLRSLLNERYGFQGIIGISPKMKSLFDLIKKAARSDAPVLIYGESGTGKELVASAIYRLGAKSKGPFIRVNCAALSQSLLESELFGHVKGAFTGADRTTKGRFEAAHAGNIFLDEIGDIPLSTQVKLLRVIEEKEVERVGDYRPIPIDVRVIAATHRDLKGLIAKGLFREDLFYRLNVIPIVVPPLRERAGDFPLLVSFFIREICARTGKCIAGVAREAMEALSSHSWPGNVRELINVIEYAFVVCNKDIITRDDLPDLGLIHRDSDTNPLEELTQQTEREKLIETLVATRGKRAAAARMLGVSRQTVWSRIRRHGIDVAQLLADRGMTVN